MEHLASSYQFVLRLIEDLRAGKTLRMSIQAFLAENHSDFAKNLLNWHIHCEKGQLSEFKIAFQKSNRSVFQDVLFDLFCLNMSGSSILEPLEALEQEMRQASRQQMDAHLAQLPFKLLLPLLFLQFPALLLLILGPLLFHLLKEVQ